MGHTHKWLESRLGTAGRFVLAYGQNHMDFFFPDASMTDKYGCFTSVDSFLEAFNTNDTWARGFYTADGRDGSGREGFTAFVLKESKKHPKGKCVWFSPQHTREVHQTLMFSAKEDTLYKCIPVFHIHQPVYVYSKR
jgi:hypothetical protein